MFGLGFGELLIVLVIILFFFGGKKLPELGNSLGKSIQAFKKGMKDEDNDDKTKKS